MNAYETIDGISRGSELILRAVVHAQHHHHAYASTQYIDDVRSKN